MPTPRPSFFFFFNDTATTEIYTLSLHDALPIYDDAAAACRKTIFRDHAVGNGKLARDTGGDAHQNRREHGRNPVTIKKPMPPSSWKKKKKTHYGVVLG